MKKNWSFCKNRRKCYCLECSGKIILQNWSYWMTWRYAKLVRIISPYACHGHLCVLCSSWSLKRKFNDILTVSNKFIYPTLRLWRRIAQLQDQPQNLSLYFQTFSVKTFATSLSTNTIPFTFSCRFFSHV